MSKSKLQTDTDDSYLTVIFYIKLSFLIFGCFGNGFSVIIWVKRDFIKMSRSISCITLALCDTTYLILNFSSLVYNCFEGNKAESVCRFLFFGVGFSQVMDSWIIVLLTAERLISGMSVGLIVFGSSKMAIFIIRGNSMELF